MKKIKKLSLNKEVIVELTDAQMINLKGGSTVPCGAKATSFYPYDCTDYKAPKATYNCPSVYDCPSADCTTPKVGCCEHGCCETYNC